MSGYELRAEHRPAYPVGRETVGWHIVHRHHLAGLCGKLIDPVSDRRPIRAIADVRPGSRCADCWAAWLAARQADGEQEVLTSAAE